MTFNTNTVSQLQTSRNALDELHKIFQTTLPTINCYLKNFLEPLLVKLLDSKLTLTSERIFASKTEIVAEIVAAIVDVNTYTLTRALCNAF